MFYCFLATDGLVRLVLVHIFDVGGLVAKHVVYEPVVVLRILKPRCDAHTVFHLEIRPGSNRRFILLMRFLSQCDSLE